MAAVLICLVVAGSLLGNSFVAGRMAVAAANRDWLPRLFSVVGRVGYDRPQANDTDDATTEDAAASSTSKSSDAPINAIILSSLLACFYILFGSFRALLTFNGLGEYSFFFLAVVGAIVLRVREPGLRRPYKPFVAIPAIFALVSGFVVVRGAIFEPILALVLVLVWILGLLVYWARARWAQ